MERSRCHAYPQPFPTLLRNLYLGQDPRSEDFLNNIRSYNAALTFTSCEFKVDTRLGFETIRVTFAARCYTV
jgi:hypothetical protein